MRRIIKITNRMTAAERAKAHAENATTWGRRAIVAASLAVAAALVSSILQAIGHG